MTFTFETDDERWARNLLSNGIPDPDDGGTPGSTPGSTAPSEVVIPPQRG